MARKRFTGVAAGAVLFAAACPALAQNFSVTPVGGITLDANVGFIRGTSKEYVFDASTGFQASKLRWDLESIAALTAGAQYRPWAWLMLGLKGTTNLSHAGHMADRDWGVPDCPDTRCLSVSPDTRSQQALMLDAFVAARFLQFGGVNLSAIAGYKWDYFRWHAFGGTANYADLPPGLGISYEQWWQAPYVGLGLDAQWGKLGFSTRVVGSWASDGRDRDHHHLTSTVFTDEFGRGGYVAADFGVTYQLSDLVRFAVDYHYQRYMEVRGPTTLRDAIYGTFFFPGEAAGGDHTSHMLSVGLKVNLQRPEYAEAGVKDGGSLKDGPVAAAPAPGWAGWYAGVAAGADLQRSGWQTTSLGLPPLGPFSVDAATANARLDSDGTVVSLFGGYNWQHHNWVVGLEAEIGKSNAGDYAVGIPGTVPLDGATNFPLATSTDSVFVTRGLGGSFRGRAGILIHPHLLAYATGGLAVESITARASCNRGFIALSGASVPGWCLDANQHQQLTKTLVGYTVGGGLEAMLAGNWLLRGEYRFTDVGAASFSFFSNSANDAISAKVDSSDHRLTAGLGYKF